MLINGPAERYRGEGVEKTTLIRFCVDFFNGTRRMKVSPRYARYSAALSRLWRLTFRVNRRDRPRAGYIVLSTRCENYESGDMILLFGPETRAFEDTSHHRLVK